jgi:hypothetical protein
MDDLDSPRTGILTSNSDLYRTPGQAALSPTYGPGCLPTLCQTLADRLDLAAVVDVDPGVRDALATLGEWMRTGHFDRLAIAQWLLGVRDVAQR